jgi:adenosylhomocysteinase
MDMSFANQFLSVLKLTKDGKSLKSGVYAVDKSQDQEIAMAKLNSMNVKIDVLTHGQQEYLTGFGEGT